MEPKHTARAAVQQSGEGKCVAAYPDHQNLGYTPGMKIRSAVVCLTLLLPGLQAEGSWAQRTQSPTVSPKVPSAQTVNQNARPNVQVFNFKPTITVSNPAGGTIPLDGKGLYVTFSAKNFDISRNGQIKFIGELLLNGTAMGV